MKKETNFEKSITDLEEAVRKLESGNMSLDEAISTFEEAVFLVKVCNRKLEEAEKKVRILTETDDGSITDEPFGDLNDET